MTKKSLKIESLKSVHQIKKYAWRYFEYVLYFLHLLCIFKETRSGNRLFRFNNRHGYYQKRIYYEYIIESCYIH